MRTKTNNRKNKTKNNNKKNKTKQKHSFSSNWTRNVILLCHSLPHIYVTLGRAYIEALLILVFA